MLNNYLFYNLNSYQLDIEEVNDFNEYEIQKLSFIKCYNSFFPKTLVKISLLENHVVFTYKQKVFKSKMPMQLCYCIKKKQTDKSITFNVFNFEIKHQLEINLRLQDEDSFRFVFKEFLIFTDFDNKLKISQFIDKGFCVENYKVILLQNQEKKLKRDKFFAKLYNKQQIQQDQLKLDLINTLKQYKRLHNNNNFLDPFGFYENQNNFIVVFSLSISTPLEKFIFLNSCIKDDRVVINLMLSLIQVFIDLENKQVQIPIIDPSKIIVTLHAFNKIMFNHHQRIYMNIQRFIQQNIKDKKNGIRASNALYLNSQESFHQQQDALQHIEELQLSNRTDINNFLLVITNTEILFRADQKKTKNQNYILVGYKKVKFLSNLFLNLTDNLNCINLGILFYYILTGINLAMQHEFIRKKGDQIDIHYLNFPAKKVKSFTQIQQQILYCFFTMNNLKEIFQKLRYFITLEKKIQEIEQQNKSISISTSSDQSVKKKNITISSDCSEDFNINDTKSMTQIHDESQIKKSVNSLNQIQVKNAEKNSQEKISSQYLSVTNLPNNKPVSTINSPDNDKEQNSEIDKSLMEIDYNLQHLNTVKTSTLTLDEVKENSSSLLSFSTENLDTVSNQLQNLFLKQKNFKPKFM